jgi:5-oxoprolinase (ATP-hydrolysing)
MRRQRNLDLQRRLPQNLRQFVLSISIQVYAEVPAAADGSPAGYRVLKLLSEDPASYSDAPREAIRRVLESVSGIPHPIDRPLDTSRIEWIRMGTTVATNALLERKGTRTAFVVTMGFGDLLHIGNQSRAKIFDLQIARPDNVYERVVQVDERVMVSTEKEGGKQWKDKEWEGKYPTTVGVTGETVSILQAPDMVKLEAELRDVFASGIRSLAVSLMHSYTFPQHEQKVGELAAKLGFTHISLSSALMPMVKLLPRSYTACADAYLTPCIHQYLTQFRKGFDEHMERNTKVTSLPFAYSGTDSDLRTAVTSTHSHFC